MTPTPNTINRRQFLKLSSGSTAALILGFNWSLASCGDQKGYEVLKNGELGKEIIKKLKTKKIKPVKENPFPDEDIL